MIRSCRANLEKIGYARSENIAQLLASYPKVAVSNCREFIEDRDQLYTQSANMSFSDVYKSAYRRWHTLKPKHKPSLDREFATRSRLVIGLGGASVHETGLTLHRIYGVPYLPGTALKGLTAAYCRNYPGGSTDANAPQFSEQGDVYRALFGGPALTDPKTKTVIKPACAGFISFLDAWLIPPPNDAAGIGIHTDVLTPHHQNYNGGPTDQEGGKFAPPTDFDEPIPVPFLSITGKFCVRLVADTSPSDPNGDKLLQLAMDLLEKALSTNGLGGKTTSGYGRMVAV